MNDSEGLPYGGCKGVQRRFNRELRALEAEIAEGLDRLEEMLG